VWANPHLAAVDAEQMIQHAAADGVGKLPRIAPLRDESDEGGREADRERGTHGAVDDSGSSSSW